MAVQLRDGHFGGVFQPGAVNQDARCLFAVFIKSREITAKKLPLECFLPKRSKEFADTLALQSCARLQEPCIIAGPPGIRIAVCLFISEHAVKKERKQSISLEWHYI